MSRIALVTDSSVCLSPEQAREYGAHVIPLYIHFDGETFQDGVDMDTATFYERLETVQKLPTTSQPSAGDFVELYCHLSAEADAIVSIHISSGLSGTMTSAQIARGVVVRGKANTLQVYVIDSRTTACGLALLVSAAARAIAKGQPASAIAKTVRTLIPRLFTVFAADTIKYLRKGGHIGGAAALVGTALQIKPLLCLNQGRISVLHRMRTAGRAKQRLLEVMVDRAGGQPIHACITHAQAPQEAEWIRRYIADHFDCRELFIVEFSPVFATLTGPGAVGVAFYAA